MEKCSQTKYCNCFFFTACRLAFELPPKSLIPVNDQSDEGFAFMQAQRFWIERCFNGSGHSLLSGNNIRNPIAKEIR